jgi:hypothetical protein
MSAGAPDDRQRGLAGVAQLAADRFALDLEPHGKEEQGHRRVVDPVVQRQLELIVAETDTCLGFPKRVVPMGRRSVGQDKCGDRAQ